MLPDAVDFVDISAALQKMTGSFLLVLQPDPAAAGWKREQCRPAAGNKDKDQGIFAGPLSQPGQAGGSLESGRIRNRVSRLGDFDPPGNFPGIFPGRGMPVFYYNKSAGYAISKNRFKTCRHIRPGLPRPENND